MAKDNHQIAISCPNQSTVLSPPLKTINRAGAKKTTKLLELMLFEKNKKRRKMSPNRSLSISCDMPILHS